MGCKKMCKLIKNIIKLLDSNSKIVYTEDTIKQGQALAAERNIC